MSARTIRDIRHQGTITTARDLFSRKGFDGTSMPDIAQAARISTELIYYIFSGKEDILLACCEEIATLLLELIEEGQRSCFYDHNTQSSVYHPEQARPAS